MTEPKKGSAGGKVMAERQREEAFKKYYNKPNYCKECGLVIPINGNKKGAAAVAKRKMFCNQSCSAKFHNRGKRKGNIEYTYDEFGTCEVCGLQTANKKKGKNSFVVRKRCDICRNLRSLLCLLPTPGDSSKYNINSIAKPPKRSKSVKFDKRVTKGEYFTMYEYYSARSTIAKKARRIYTLSNKPRECLVCGYNLHVEVCHIKSVMEFEDTTLIDEINNIDNLVALCRNHHWELDRGIINLIDYL